MEDLFGIAAFRSRQQVMNFEGVLRRAGLRVKVISTPRDVAIGCGLSVQFNLDDAPQVIQALERTRPSNLIGLYRVDRRGPGRPSLTVLARM